MGELLALAVLAGLGYWLFREGKRRGSQGGFRAGVRQRRRRRQGRRHRH